MRKLKTPVKIVFLTISVLILNRCSGPPPQPPAGTDSTAAVSFQQMLEDPYADLQLTRGQQKGKQLFDHFCAVCHGENGDGNGFNAFNLESSFGVKPFNFSDSAAMAGMDEQTLLKAIGGGGPAVGKSKFMPPWGHTLSPGQIRWLAQYIRTFVRREENVQ